MQVAKIDISTKKHPNTFALIDAGDERLLAGVKKWGPVSSSTGALYARSVSTRKAVSMHRMIMGVTNPNVHVDHINGNPLDNRRANLRLVTRSQNMQNSAKHTLTPSGFKGVYKRRYGWAAAIVANGDRVHLGAFKTSKDAAIAYDAAAIRLHGEFAKTNEMMGLI